MHIIERDGLPLYVGRIASDIAQALGEVRVTLRVLEGDFSQQAVYSLFVQRLGPFNIRGQKAIEK